MSLAFAVAIPSTQAGLVAHYRVEEGAVDSATNATYCSIADTNFGSLDATAGGTLEWVTSSLPPVPSAGTTAALHFVSLPNGSANHPHVATTMLTEDQTGNNLAGPGPKAITAWIKPQIFPTNDINPTIVHIGPATPNGARVTFKGVVAGSVWQLRAEFQGGGRTGTKNLADGNWHHVAVVMPTNTSGTVAVSNVLLYVDGALETISVSSGPAVNVNLYTNRAVILGSTFGSGLAGGDRGFTGYLDDVRLYNDALSAADILNIYLGPGTPPSATQLGNQQLVLGSTNTTVTFTAGAVGTPPLQITWKKDGTTQPGETNDTLILSPAGVGDLGVYTVAVTNAYGGTTKSAALTLNTAPIKPPRQAVLVGHPATFSVAMPADSSGYSYQWRTNEATIAGATAATLTIASAASSDAGTNYQVVVTLGGNSATSTPAASLRVLSAPASAYARAVLGDVPAGYWRLNENNGATVAASETTDYPGTYQGYTGAELQAVGAITNDANNCSTFTSLNYVEVPYDFELVRADGLTLEAWVNLDSTGTRQSLIACWGNLPNLGYELFVNTAGQPVFRTYRSTSPAAPTINDLPGPNSLTPGTWSHIVATYNGETKMLFVDGTPVGSQTTLYFPAVSIPLRFGAGGSGLPLDPLYGRLDEVAIYSQALTYAQVVAHYETGSGLTAPPLPSLTIEPVGTDLMISWPGAWVLQTKSAMDDSPTGWADVAGDPNPYTFTPTDSQGYFRLRSP